MEAHGDNSSKNFTALNFGESDVVDSLLQMPQQNVRTDNVDIVDAGVTEAVVENQPQVDSSFNHAAEDGSGGSLLGAVEVGGSSLLAPNEQNEAAEDMTAVPGSGGITVEGPSPPSSIANEAAEGGILIEGPFRASSIFIANEAAESATTGVPAGTSSEFARNMNEMLEYEIYQTLVAAHSHYRGPVNGDPSPADSPNDSPPEPPSASSFFSTIPPSSILTARSLLSASWPAPTPLRQRISSGSIPGNATTENLPWALPPYRPSSSFTDPFSPSQFPSYVLSYIRELDERFLDEGTMDDGNANLFNNDDVVENAGGEAAAVDPITGRSAETSRFHPYEISPPNQIRSLVRRARILSQINHHMENALHPAVQIWPPLHRLPEEMPDDVDVDAMSYEQLLELEERMGMVYRGLEEETIAAHVNRLNFHSQKNESSTDDSRAAESCCVCQEEYVDGDELAKWICVHKFHYECIKQWLMLKNQCPLCKLIGLRV